MVCLFQLEEVRLQANLAQVLQYVGRSEDDAEPGEAAASKTG